MSELTRDEIRRACEAVPGWTWKRGNPKLAGSVAEVDRAYDAMGFLRFLNGSQSAEDALALLEATGHAFKVHHVPGRAAAAWWLSWDVPWPSPTTWHAGSTFPEAAVRAVLAWAEGKETKGREGVA